MSSEGTPTYEGRRISRRLAILRCASVFTAASVLTRARTRSPRNPNRSKESSRTIQKPKTRLHKNHLPQLWLRPSLNRELETRRRHLCASIAIAAIISALRFGPSCAKRGAVAPRSARTAPGRKSSARDAAAVTRNHGLRRDEPHLRRDAHDAPLLQSLYSLASADDRRAADVRL